MCKPLNIFNLIGFFFKDINKGITPNLFKQSYEARFSTAFWLAKKEYFKEATILFNNLQEEANNKYKSAIHYNIGNIFFIRGLKINGTSNSTVVRQEAEYLLIQAKKAYIKSIKLDISNYILNLLILLFTFNSNKLIAFLKSPFDNTVIVSISIFLYPSFSHIYFNLSIIKLSEILLNNNIVHLL